jgi:hypothetical protein
MRSMTLRPIARAFEAIRRSGGIAASSRMTAKRRPSRNSLLRTSGGTSRTQAARSGGTSGTFTSANATISRGLPFSSKVKSAAVSRDRVPIAIERRDVDLNHVDGGPEDRRLLPGLLRRQHAVTAIDIACATLKARMPLSANPRRDPRIT